MNFNLYRHSSKMVWIQNEFITYYQTIYNRLLEYQPDDIELVKLIYSVLRLIWIQLHDTFNFISVIQSLYNVLMIFVHFLFNNLYEIKQINNHSMILIKLFILGSQAVLFYILTHYGIKHLFYPIITLILTTTQTYWNYVNHYVTFYIDYVYA